MGKDLPVSSDLKSVRAAAILLFQSAMGRNLASVAPSRRPDDLAAFLAGLLPSTPFPVAVLLASPSSSGLVFSGSVACPSPSGPIIVAVIQEAYPSGRAVSWLCASFAVDPPPSPARSAFSSLLGSSAFISRALLQEAFDASRAAPDCPVATPSQLVALFASLRGLDVDAASLEAGWLEQDKGRIGKLMEILSGLPNDTTDQSDLPGGCDIKSTRIRANPDGGSPLLCESISLAVMDFDELAGCSFEQSRVFAKCQSLVIVAIEKRQGRRYIAGASWVPLFSDPQITAQASRDWEELRSLLRSDGPNALSSADGLGQILMARPKGGQSRYMATDADRPRGFYLRPSFANSLLDGISPLPADPGSVSSVVDDDNEEDQ